MGFSEAVDIVDSVRDTGYRVLPFPAEWRTDTETVKVSLEEYLGYFEREGIAPDVVGLAEIDPEEYEDYEVDIPWGEAVQLMSTVTDTPSSENRREIRKFLQEVHGVSKREAALIANQSLALARLEAEI